MTTNKPEILGYCVKRDRGRWERSNNYYLSPNPDENYTVPVIRLSDYEALQAECRILESELATVKKVAYGNVDLLDECERLRKNAERYHRLRTGDIDDIAVVRGLGAMDYGMSAVIGTYSEEIDGDVLDETIDAAMISNHENQQT